MPAQASPSATQLDGLLALISSSIEVVKSHYTKQGHVIPSLDSVVPHPLDSVLPRLELIRAVQTIEGACAQLTAIVAPPGQTIINRAMAGHEVACLRVVTEVKVADILKAAGGTGVTLSELSSKTGIEVGKLGRIMRYLATKHIFRETKEGVFINNRLSILLESANEFSSLSLYLTDDSFKTAAGLYDVLSDPKYGSSYAPHLAPITKIYNFPDQMKTFEWFHANRFNRGLIGWSQATGTSPLVTTYPWNNLPASATMTDVGGGVGHASLDLAREFPHLKFVIQDLPGTIEQGREFWKKEYPEAIENQRVQWKAFDFFTSSPVEGSDVYYLRYVIHGWGDQESVQILTNIRKVMKPGSKVLIHEYILQTINPVSLAEARYNRAPEPLLPHYGVGRILQYNVDLHMMGSFNSKVRTLEEFTKLGEEAGLKFFKLYDAGETCILEFGLA